MSRIPTIVVDSSEAMTDLCLIGGAAGTDKSPFNKISHRHPYTAVYTVLFASLRSRPIHFAEIGVAGGASAILWDAYFRHPAAEIHMFDRDENFLQNAARLVGPRVKFGQLDVTSEDSLQRVFGQDSGRTYDVIIDDSTHNVPDQIRIIKAAFPALRPGGQLIIEDVFRSTMAAEYESQLQDILPHCAAAYFVICEHANRWSPGWDNDRLLVLVKA